MSDKKERNSNLELFRIITMFFIVAHHYVVNSGLNYADGPIFRNMPSVKSLYLLLFGAWGKTGINCFVLFSGYFLCHSGISFRQFMKLLGEWMFYKIAIYFLFVITGYTSLSIMELFLTILPIQNIAQNFTGCYLVFYLAIPFLNILIHRLNKRQHFHLLCWCFFVYVFLGTFPLFSVVMNYVSWFMVLYLLSSYIKLYPEKVYDNTKLWGCLSLAFIVLCMVSVLACVCLDKNPYMYVSDSNTFLAIATGLSLFMFFKNVKIRNSKIINAAASIMFGILLIHANSDAMRQWLWKDVLNNVGAYDGNIYLHSVLSVTGVMIVCGLIDYARIVTIEKIVLEWFDRPKTASIS